MKKALLATTVLAAVSVATPVLAEVTVSGYYRFGWSSYSDDIAVTNVGNSKVEDSITSTVTDSEIHIKFSKTTDSGLTYGATFELEGDAAGVDESSLSLSGDFGTFILGSNDYAHDSFITWAPTHYGTYTADDQANLPAPRFAKRGILGQSGDPYDGGIYDVRAPYYAGNASYTDDKKITYMSPDLSGFKFGVSVTDDAGEEKQDISLGASFSGGFGAMGGDMMDGGMMSGVTYKFTANLFDNNEIGEEDYSSEAFGATLGVNAMTFTASTSVIEFRGDELSAIQLGFGYQVNDALALGVSWSEGEEDIRDHELGVISLSVQYTIAPGLTATAALNDYTAEDKTLADTRRNDATGMVFSIKAAF